MDTPLPPYFRYPRQESFRVLVRDSLPEEISLAHVEEPGYAVLAAMAVAGRLGTRQVERLVDVVKSLVGEVDLKVDLSEETKKEQ
jgi:hypothetical protein